MSFPIQSTNFSIFCELDLFLQEEQCSADSDADDIMTTPMHENSETLFQEIDYINMLHKVQQIVHNSKLGVIEKMKRIKSEYSTTSNCIAGRRHFFLGRSCHVLDRKEDWSLIHILCEMQFSRLKKEGRKKYLQFIEFFLDKGYRLDQESSLGKTPLQIFLLLHYPHNRDIVIELLKKNVDITTVDSSQQTIFDSIWPDHFELFISDLLSISQCETLHENTKVMIDFIHLLAVNKKPYAEISQDIRSFCRVYSFGKSMSLFNQDVFQDASFDSVFEEAGHENPGYLI